MLKTRRDDIFWLISQPDHAEAAGYLAAHWGNAEFVRPGSFAESIDPEGLRNEVVFAIANHDNGWWEWEADPELSDIDGLPKGLLELLGDRQKGMDRWRLGIPRFRSEHPYASLLISFHALWLYAMRTRPDSDPAFAHPLYWKGGSALVVGEEVEDARAFVAEIESIQQELITRLRQDPVRAQWSEGEHLNPHVRLHQILDGLSLALCSALIPPREGEPKGLGEDEFDLLDVPRRSWEDRVTIRIRPVGERRIVCSPYPFDVDPLPVAVPGRALSVPDQHASRFATWSSPKRLLQFEFHSG